MDRDIQDMFRQKNREMLIHNLQLDIDRNVVILKETLINVFDLQFEIATKNICVMYNESLTVSKIEKILGPLKDKTFALLSNAIDAKKEKLLGRLNDLEFEKDKMDEYYDEVFSTTEIVIEVFKSDEFNNLKKNAIEIFYNNGNSCLDEEEFDIVQYRIRDYITDRLFGKLEDRVKEELFIRDRNLCNKGKEGYEKYQELEERTTQS